MVPAELVFGSVTMDSDCLSYLSYLDNEFLSRHLIEIPVHRPPFKAAAHLRSGGLGHHGSHPGRRSWRSDSGPAGTQPALTLSAQPDASSRNPENEERK